MKEKCNLYSVGLFQKMEDVPEKGKELLNFARKVTYDLQDSGFYDVDDVNKLEFTFGEVAQDITDQLKDIYIRDTKEEYRHVLVQEFIDNDESLEGVKGY